MFKYILAAVMLLVGSASAQWLGQARQTAVLTNGLSTIASPRSNVQQVVEWINNNWPTNISLSSVYLNAGNIYFTNFWTGTNQITYQQTASNNLSTAIAGLTNNFVKGTNIAGAVSFANNTWSLKTPRYFFEAYRTNQITSGVSNTWYEVASYETQAVVSGGPFSISSGRYTAPLNGWYMFNAAISRRSDILSNYSFRAAISVNGNTNFVTVPFLGVQLGSMGYASNTGARITTYNGSYFTRLLSNDYVSLVHIHTDNLGEGSNYILNAYMSGFMLQEAGYDQ